MRLERQMHYAIHDFPRPSDAKAILGGRFTSTHKINDSVFGPLAATLRQVNLRRRRTD